MFLSEAGTVRRMLAGRRSPRACESVCFNVASMPKMKTHSGAKKRFRKTAKGKLRGRRAYSSHILEKKSPGRKRRFERPSEISEADRKRVNKLLVKGGR
jgi:large subunit ribosomal protein L35